MPKTRTEPLDSYKHHPGITPHRWKPGEIETVWECNDIMKEIITDWDSWEMGLFTALAATGSYFEVGAMCAAQRFRDQGCRFTFAEFLEAVRRENNGKS